MIGTLYLVATPIGNLDDMSFRAIKTLNEVSLIACEDTRTSRPLLEHFEIKTPVTSYHKFNETEKTASLIEKLLTGTTEGADGQQVPYDIALITDAGTPGISDPGEILVKACIENGIPVVPIPGPVAFVSAAVASGLPTRRIAFEAFLPTETRERQDIMSQLKSETRTIVVYESPHHLKKTITDLSDALGKDRKLTICRELTKKYEEKIRMTFGEALDYYGLSSDEAASVPHEPRGEYVLVIAGKSKEEQQAENAAKWSDLSIKEHVEYYEKEKGLPRKEAMKAAAKDRGLTKRDIYATLLDK